MPDHPLTSVGGGGVIVEDEGPAGDPNGGDPDEWAEVASLGTERKLLAAASDANGLVYAIGGASDANDYESVVEQLRFDPLFADAYSATGDTLFTADDPDAELLNRTTDRSVTGDSLIARDGETIAWVVESQARLYRTEEQ